MGGLIGGRELALGAWVFQNTKGPIGRGRRNRGGGPPGGGFKGGKSAPGLGVLEEISGGVYTRQVLPS